MKNHAPDYDMVVIAGDLFDSESAPFSLIEEVAQMLADCKHQLSLLAVTMIV